MSSWVVSGQCCNTLNVNSNSNSQHKRGKKSFFWTFSFKVSLNLLVNKKWTFFTSGGGFGIQYYYHCHKILPFLQPLSLQPLIKIKYIYKENIFPLGQTSWMSMKIWDFWKIVHQIFIWVNKEIGVKIEGI